MAYRLRRVCFPLALCAAAATIALAVPHTRAEATEVRSAQPVLMSFDDGPDPVWTPRMLQVLTWKHVHAVFCVTG